MNPLESWGEEQRSAYLYRACAEAESGTPRAALFARLAIEAEAQAAIWRAQLTARGHPPPGPYVPDERAKLVARLVHWLGPRRLRAVLAAMKVRGMAIYGNAVGDEGGHAVPTAGSGVEHRHRNLGGGGNLRAAVFGVSDGLVSNASLILGVSGASPDPHLVLLSGVAGLAAGAFAMAAGEYVSVRSQRELYEHQIALERDELNEYPEAEAQELALIYVAKGLPQAEADKLAQRPDRRSGARARHARTRRIGTQSRRAGLPGGRRGEFVRRLCRRGSRAAGAILVCRGQRRVAHRDRHHGDGAVRRRCGAVIVYRTQRLALGLAHTGAGRVGGRRDVRHR
jgi:VIT1/CCC1 family predicted Fe2+/Mn2+ transporter